MEFSWLQIVLLTPAAILLAAGVGLLLLFVLGNLMQIDVHFESSDGKWADTESTFKAYDYPTVICSFEAYKGKTKKPVTMVRTTPIEWRRIQLWPTYLINPKWRVPYAPRKIVADQLFPPEMSAARRYETGTGYPKIASTDPLMPTGQSDAWLLLSIIYSGSPADRARIIEVGDGINHADFTTDEIEGGLGRLISARLICEKDGHFVPTDSVVTWFRSVSPKRSYIYKDIERVEGFLRNQAQQRAPAGRPLRGRP